MYINACEPYYVFAPTTIGFCLFVCLFVVNILSYTQLYVCIFILQAVRNHLAATKTQGAQVQKLADNLAQTAASLEQDVADQEVRIYSCSAVCCTMIINYFLGYDH